MNTRNLSLLHCKIFVNRITGYQCPVGYSFLTKATTEGRTFTIARRKHCTSGAQTAHLYSLDTLVSSAASKLVPPTVDYGLRVYRAAHRAPTDTRQPRDGRQSG
ncbi:hypothetical protein B0H10DRAFT_894440 [Mycena sp. CBHHK59/15]|nr:hypothetical protein B0H10DRAFT_894440 [Mycena sp. CBHHK59/15]